jgi:curved DNA-binding protein CbpA
LIADKNPNDPTAHERFQGISEAYEVLSHPDLRAAYDKYGKDKAKPQEGFTDPAEFFGEIFGGEAFVDLIGEISLMRDLTKTMEMATDDTVPETVEEFPDTEAAINASRNEAAAAGAGASFTSPEKNPIVDDEKPSAEPGWARESKPASTAGTSPAPSGTSSPRPAQQTLPTRPAQISHKADSEHRLETANMTEEEKAKLEKKKKAELSAAQRQKMAEFEAERSRIRKERVDTLAKKLLDRISIWTETDKGDAVTFAFQEKTRLEVENLKMESFGIDILHAIGATYMSKASGLVKSQKFLGIGGFFSRLKDKGTLAKDTWNTISSALDAQVTMEEMAKAEEKGGEEWSDERRVEYERRVTGKILTAAWRGSKFEIQSVLRDVCDKVLYDKTVPIAKRLERAHALLISGEVYAKVCSFILFLFFVRTFVLIRSWH